MGKELLNDVKSEHVFVLSNGKNLQNLKELYKELRKMDKKTFTYHVNEEKNDFYNWVRDIYKDKKLSDDLLECTTREAMMFCLKENLKQASATKSLDELPKGYSREEILFDLLPRGYDKQRINQKTASANKLVTLINLDEIRTKSEVKALFDTGKNFTAKVIKTDDPFEELAKKSMKKIKALDSKSMIEKVKGVYLSASSI